MPSYSPVFSSQFIVYSDSTPNSSFIVPAGFTAVIRDMTGYANVSATLLHLLIGDSSLAPAVTVASIELAGVGTYGQWTGRVVVPEDGIIEIYSGSLVSGLQVYVGGYLLRNVIS